MNNTNLALGSDISDSGSDSDEDMVEADSALLADIEEMRKKVRGPMEKHRLQLIRSFTEAAKSEEKVNNSKLKLKDRIKAKSRIIDEREKKIREMEQSRDFWKTEAQQRKVSEEKLKADNNQQAVAIKNLNKELEKYKMELKEVKHNLERKLTESESRYENLRKMSDEEIKNLKTVNKTNCEKNAALERAKKDLEANTAALLLQISNLDGNLQRVTSEKDQVTLEKKEALQSVQNLEAVVTSKESVIESLINEELDRRNSCTIMNQLLFQRKDHYKEMLKNKNVADVNLSCIMPETNFSNPQKRSPMNSIGDGAETAVKKRKAISRNSGHVSEEEGEIVNQQPQPQVVHLENKVF